MRPMMMWQAVLLGILQGVTEFLPISSSGHLALAQMMMPHFEQPGVVFDAMLHVGTATAVVFFERRQIAAWVSTPSGRWLLGLLILGTGATAVVAFPLRHMAEGAFERPLLVGLALVVTGIVVGCTKFLPGGEIGERETTWRQVALVGLAQGLAIFPGLSRSGTTIAASLGCGLNRSWAARFSFLLSVPVIGAATGAQVFGARDELMSIEGTFWLACLVGSLAAAIAGYGALRLVVKSVSSEVFHRFAWYCVPIGCLVILFSVGW